MTYTIRMRIDDGKIVNHEVFGDIPDGQIEVAGHESPDLMSINVARHGPDGAPVLGAQHSESFARHVLMPVPDRPYPTAVPPKVPRG